MQREHILRVLNATHWVIEGNSGAALRLGLKPATLRHRMKKLGNLARPQSTGHLTAAMPSVAEHYERVLSPVYAWMAGGVENALAAGRVEIDALAPATCRPVPWWWTSGAGFGMHAIPLARAGARVIADRQLGATAGRAEASRRRSAHHHVQDDLL